jgi:hypothetical protein
VLPKLSLSRMCGLVGADQYAKRLPIPGRDSNVIYIPAFSGYSLFPRA